MNRIRITNIGVYIVVGLVLWQSMQHTGINPTLTGIILSLVYPENGERGKASVKAADQLKPWVYFFIVPLFAFFNSGISLVAIKPDTFEVSILLSVFLGLVFGKLAGIVLAARVATIIGLCELPSAMSWSHIIGCGFLAGIGFTMSLFISSLAFENQTYLESARASILLGSIASALIGIAILSVKPRVQVKLP